MSARKSIEQTYFEQARAEGLDHAEAWELASTRTAEHARRAGEAAAVQEITVDVKGNRYTVSGSMLSRIEGDRERAASFKRAYNAPAEVKTRTELRKHIMRSFGVDADTAMMILAACRKAPVTGWRPEMLDMAVYWEGKGWQLRQVTGTRHAYYLLRKLAGVKGFRAARLNDPLVRRDGWILDNVLHFSLDDITGSDTAGKYRALLDRRNSHYDLQRDALKD